MSIEIRRESPDGLQAQTWTFAYYDSACPAATGHTLKVTYYERQERKSKRGAFRTVSTWSHYNKGTRPGTPSDVIDEARKTFCDSLTVYGA